MYLRHMCFEFIAFVWFCKNFKNLWWKTFSILNSNSQISWTASNIVHFYNDKLMHQVRIWLILILFSYFLSCLFDSSFLRLKKTQTVFLFSPMIHKRRTCFPLILDLTIIKSNWIHYLFNCSNININSNNKRISSMFSFSGEKWFEINFNY